MEFEVIQSQEGSYAAACHSHNIYTEGDTLQMLYDNIIAAIQQYYPDPSTRPNPNSVNLILFRDIPIN